jgi:2-amino-4-hydroxy-6-hydroxymethyldihydropteridine diphosphokinase
MSSVVYLGLGTNLGCKDENLHRAIQMIEERVGRVISRSSFYCSEPWGFISEHTFLNVVLSLTTVLGPEEVLFITQKIEKEMGRKEKSNGLGYVDRLIDIDILLFDNLIISTPNLQIPHPLMLERLFVMVPLAEIAPDLQIPQTEKTVKMLLDELK